MNVKILNGILFVFGFFICILFFLALIQYPGKSYIYILYSLSLNILLFSGFRKGMIFFDLFIGVFFWLGFWLKYSIRLAFFDGRFYEAVGNFDYSGGAHDKALVVTSCGILALLLASYIREKYFFSYSNENREISLKGIYNFYQRYRKPIWLVFCIFFVIFSATNIFFGMYQRGLPHRTNLPFGLNGIFKWWLLFGGASFSSLILYFEFVLNKKTSYLVVALTLLESFLSNVSMISRGMVLNMSALFAGVMKSLKPSFIFSNFRFLSASFLIFIVLFGSSVLIAHQIRSIYFKNPSTQATTNESDKATRQARILMIDRWVGIEGVMAISSFPKLGWELWNKAWGETYSDHGTSFFDSNLITSFYTFNSDLTTHHFITLPGILAFFFYPGSFVFLFISMFFLGALGAGIEISIYKMIGANLILCALFGQVVASRYVHFGYVPRQSYLLFGTIYLNIFIIYFANKFLLYWNKN